MSELLHNECDYFITTTVQCNSYILVLQPKHRLLDEPLIISPLSVSKYRFCLWCIIYQLQPGKALPTQLIHAPRAVTQAYSKEINWSILWYWSNIFKSESFKEKNTFERPRPLSNVVCQRKYLLLLLCEHSRSRTCQVMIGKWQLYVQIVVKSVLESSAPLHLLWVSQCFEQHANANLIAA